GACCSSTVDACAGHGPSRSARPEDAMTTHASHDDLSPDLGARERAYVFAVAMKYVKNEVDAEDVTQDALLLAHRHRDSFRGDARYGTWLYRVAATTALMFLRSR